MRRTALIGIGVLLATAVVLGEDFWVKKEYTQWTDDEVKKLMTNSPWAKDITINAPASTVGQRAATSSADVENPSAASRPSRNRRSSGDSGDGEGGGSQVFVTVNMSWRSALPMRKGLVRSRLGSAGGPPPDAEELMKSEPKEYVVVVSGVPARMAAAIQNPENLSRSELRIGKRSLAPKAFDIQKRTQTLDVIFLFPKDQPIVADEKEVEVVVQLGTIEVKRKFNLKEMMYNGKLEL